LEVIIVSTKHQKGKIRMKQITKIATIALIMGSNLLIADDYALTDNYKLLNDMRLAQQQQEIIVNINKVLNKKNIEVKSLSKETDRFNKVLIGLIQGDLSLHLKGTNIPTIKKKLKEVKNLWDKELNILKDKSIAKDKKDKAIANLNNIMIKMSEAINLYNKSYDRFKQKSKISSIVNRHINSKNKIFAFNIVQ
jgi:hypothetical protein